MDRHVQRPLGVLSREGGVADVGDRCGEWRAGLGELAGHGMLALSLSDGVGIPAGFEQRCDGT